MDREVPSKLVEAIEKFVGQVRQLEPQAQVFTDHAFSGAIHRDTILRVVSQKFKQISFYCVWLKPDGEVEGSHWGVDVL